MKYTALRYMKYAARMKYLPRRGKYVGVACATFRKKTNLPKQKPGSTPGFLFCWVMPEAKPLRGLPLRGSALVSNIDFL